jgi:hypothetical protein
MLSEGKVGPLNVSDGAVIPLRQNRDGALAVQCIHGDFFEGSYRNQQFTACTAVAGVAPGTALGTTPPFCLWNPANSGKAIVVVKAFMGYISGTLGAGTVVFAQSAVANNQPAAPTTGAALPVRSNYIGNAAAGVGIAYQGSTIAAVPLIFRPAFMMGAAVITTPFQPCSAVDTNDGDILIAPGNVLCLQAVAAAGTSPLALFGMTWEEVPV